MEPNKPEGNCQDEMAFTLQKNSRRKQGWTELAAVSNLVSENFPDTCKSMEWQMPWCFLGSLVVFWCGFVVVFFLSWLACFIFKNTFHITKVCNISACTRQINTHCNNGWNELTREHLCHAGEQTEWFRKEKFLQYESLRNRVNGSCTWIWKTL